ncbi:SPFH domain-containing protein [Actinocorallia sp. A-T 12471]|uniref:SPFH domain-containing protein n=1 Tax=Actinocorallia sp. A-T 12471 TaxID=3089813 RepID=UPI0029CB3E2D|nr:SPFH domain-containing protein [Actinocorallia sp. A-T 12471]MDX6741198.1 SPFH domain-containing protein [Actinocorallia sp. A-T 12471]
MRFLKALAAVAVLVLLTGLSAGCSVSVAPDHKGIEYNAGPFSSTKFDACGNGRIWHGPGDQVFTYPIGQRTYKFGDGGDTDALKVVSRDDLELTVEGVATFSLNDDCATLRKFHEEIGLKYEAYEEEGWGKMLRTYIGAPLDRALDEVSKKYPWQDLYSDPDTKRKWESEVGAAVAAQVNATAGDNFFCAPTYNGTGECGAFLLTLQQPVPPDNVRAALAAAQQAIEDNNTQENRNKQIRTEIQALKELVKVLGPNGAVLYQAIKDGKITVVPVPQGGNLNITPTP